MDYAFILGKNPDMSVAELASFFKKNPTSYDTFTAIFSFEDQLHAPHILNRLGGTTKIIEIFDRGPQNSARTILGNFLKNNVTGTKKIFGVNILNTSAGRTTLLLKKILLGLKKDLKRNTVNPYQKNSEHGEREGEAHSALPNEGATQAPIMKKRSSWENRV